MTAPRGGLGYLLIGQPSLSGMVSRALATKGAQPQYLEGRYELGVQALDLTDPEYRYLRRTSTFTGFCVQGAVAAQTQVCAFSIGAAGTARQIVAVLEEITIFNENAAAQRYIYGISNIDNIGVTSGPFFGGPADDRIMGQDAAASVQSSAYFFTQTAAGPFITANRSGACVVPGGGSLTIQGPWILSGRTIPTLGVFSTFVVQPGAVNLNVGASFRWYERDLLTSEL